MHLQQEDEFGEEESDQEFILNILAASPSTRDSRGYMASFHPPTPEPAITLEAELPTAVPPAAVSAAEPDNQLVTQLLNPIVRRPALVKIQGPFTDHQLASIARGIHYLQKLGLVSVVVIDRDDIPPYESENAAAAEAQRTLVLRDVERVVHYLTKARAPARPILATVARLSEEGDVYVEAEGLDHVRRAVEDGEIPVLMPVALDQGCRSRRISANGVLCALAEAMSTSSEGSVPITAAPPGGRLDLTPVRLLIINREGGIPSYARYGLPHLSINLSSEFDYINRTFQPNWRQSHPTALSNLALADECLSHMPRTSSALIVSHRSPAALIANLITNKPAHSSSLPHALLEQSEGRITPDTPTLIRRGMPVRILRKMEDIDKAKLTTLMERSFNRVLNQDAYWARLEKDLDFVIVIGDYAAAAVVTHEGRDEGQDICYLDKFAVLPSHQGDGTVDFLWVALRDETYGLGLQDAANPSVGSLSGVGRGRDLVWRSRANNPVNKWYFERSNGFVICGTNKMFWCDAEQRMREIAQETGGLMRVVDPSESDRIAKWAPVIENIKSAWSD
ncbi:Amino-acid acetyltransferase, mitochondrial [Vanrija pseudolonga]|uniref:Amino-acid acetyltransferase, mitochondrial n=1 Tax=Vanrija pseudolonga TaxID=143232 RepID=A0AAF0YDM5_9TREE|nr:Amino-acid acetyltransferase, mitochondrial [Vanrija pseudolonga]